MAEIKKAIIPMAGLGTRFLPLSKAVPKEFWPLAGEPIIHYLLKEAIDSGIEQIIFVLSPDNKKIMEYVKPSAKIEKILKERKKEKILEEFKKFEESFKKISFKYVLQRKPLGDGHAILQAAKLLKKDEPVAVFFADDMAVASKPCLLQLMATFKTCQKPVFALVKMPKEKLHAYGVPSVEKIANRFFKIKSIVEKPDHGKEPSDFAIMGRYILTPEVFQYLKKAKPSEKGEIILAEVYNRMLKEGKLIYGYEFEGKWVECGNKLDWMKANMYMCLNDPKNGQEIKKFLKDSKMV
ncbi:MAG: sugar phosphate nucleotidyltransferase [Candidatus Nealsonbacteria bacterium]|nr:sugar phosphate nucleotidyltransferase [Candidatus Nealsonbacteria bacterium]